MSTAIALSYTNDSSCNKDLLKQGTLSDYNITGISKEQLVSKIKDIYPASSNKLREHLFRENLVKEVDDTEQSSSSSISWLQQKCKRTHAFNSLLKREGIIISLSEDFFTAKLVDPAHNDVDEVADFPYNEVSDDDQSLLTVGAVFYWNIGYKLSPTGQKERSSLIRFRRIPAWTTKEIDNASTKAEELSLIFGL